MDDWEKDLGRAGRLDLLNEYKQMSDNLTATQKRCTELIDDYRDARSLCRELGASDPEINVWIELRRQERKERKK